jgi:hypothetical protein
LAKSIRNAGRPIRKNRQHPSKALLGPFKIFGSIYQGHRWANSRKLAVFLRDAAWPIQKNRRHLLGLLLGPFKQIGGISQGRYKKVGSNPQGHCWAHSSKSAVFNRDTTGPIQANRQHPFGTLLGPVDGVGGSSQEGRWAHPRQSAASFAGSGSNHMGPFTLIVRLRCGPTQCLWSTPAMGPCGVFRDHRSFCTWGLSSTTTEFCYIM